MLRSRTLRRWIARLLLGTLLFAQFAVAAYACPLMAPASQQQYATPSAVGEAGALAATFADGKVFDAGPLDAAQPGLCMAHCQFGQQNADANSTPGVPAAMWYSAYPLKAENFIEVSRLDRPADIGFAEPTDPPHAILHCCYRI